MSSNIDDLLPTTKDFMKKLVLSRADGPSKQAKRDTEAQAEKKVLLDRLTKSSGVSDHKYS